MNAVQLAERLRKFEASNIDQVILLAQVGGSRHEDICASLELFAREVMPEFQALEPEHQAWKRAVLSRDIVLEELEIDEDRVFMTGHSSGGFMSFSFATTHASKVAAIAPVAGLVVNRSKPALPVSVLSIHGMGDDVVPYGKGRWGTPSAPESAELFAQHNGCGPVERTELKKGRVLCDRWTDGRAETEVVFYSIEGGDHGWPQGGSRSVAATKLIWEFFEAHPRKAEEPEEEKGDEGGKGEKGQTNEDDDRP